MDVRLLKYALKTNKDRNVYIGSGEKARNLPRSPLAMPYELRIMWTGDPEKDEKDRNEKIAQYKIYLWQVMKNPDHRMHDAVWSELRRLREESILLCYCYPRNCHGHVIIAAWKWARENGKLDIPRQEPPIQQTMTNADDLKTLETQARANLTKNDTKGTALLPRHIAPGPLDMMQIMDRLGASLGTELTTQGVIREAATQNYPNLLDQKLDEEILETHAIDCDHCIETEKKAPRTRRPRLSFDEPRSLIFNLADDMLMDLADLAPVIAKHEAQDRAFDRAEARYEREQLALVCHESVSQVA